MNFYPWSRALIKGLALFLSKWPLSWLFSEIVTRERLLGVRYYDLSIGCVDRGCVIGDA